MATKYEKPSKSPSVGNITVRVISDDEARAKQRVNQEQYRQLLQQGSLRPLEVTCANYAEARLLAQRLTATRSSYGFEVKIAHRGKLLILTPREPPIDIQTLPPGDVERDGPEDEGRIGKPQIPFTVEEK